MPSLKYRPDEKVKSQFYSGGFTRSPLFGPNFFLEDRNKIFLNQRKDYNNLKNSDYKREKMFKLKSFLCLMLGS